MAFQITEKNVDMFLHLAVFARLIILIQTTKRNNHGIWRPKHNSVLFYNRCNLMGYSDMIQLLILRLILKLLSVFILPIPIIYADIRKLNRLPWGLDPIFGCEEDGWNGNGIDPANPRQGWIEGDWGKWHEEFRGTEMVPTGTQGWWPDYLKVNWNSLNPVQRWWLAYRWLIRNNCWNLRLKLGINIHYDNVDVTEYKKDGSNIVVRWIDKTTGKKHWYKCNKYFSYGWEFYHYVIDESDPLYDRIHNHGYTREYKYKIYSIPSINRS